jgi:hypothetical protein
MMKKPQAKTGKKNATSAKLTQLGRQAGIAGRRHFRDGC